jgi:hypothetical protein
MGRKRWRLCKGHWWSSAEKKDGRSTPEVERSPHSVQVEEEGGSDNIGGVTVTGGAEEFVKNG